MTIRMSPVLRSNLRVALMPLGIAVITRGLAELEALIEGRLRRLADVENRLAARELALGRLDDALMDEPYPHAGDPRYCVHGYKTDHHVGECQADAAAAAAVP